MATNKSIDSKLLKKGYKSYELEAGFYFLKKENYEDGIYDIISEKDITKFTDFFEKYPNYVAPFMKCRVINICCEAYDSQNKSVTIIYQDENKEYGIINSKTVDNLSRGVKNITGFDAIKKISNSCYQIKKYLGTGLGHGEDILIKPYYKNISYAMGEKTEKGRKEYFILTNESGVLSAVAVPISADTKEKDLVYLNDKEFTSITFLKDIIVCKDDKYTYIYAYDSNIVYAKISTLPLNIDIKETEEIEKGYNVYLINGQKFYFKPYKEGEVAKFMKVLDKESYLVTKYDFDLGTVIVSNTDPEKHYHECEEIDNMNDEDINLYLKRLWYACADNPLSYPELAKKIEKPNRYK